MIENKEHTELRSDEVQEIMSHVPNWLIRWGITLIFVLITLGIFMTWFIKYPDVIAGSVSISTEQPTIKLVTKNSGEINALNYSDHQNVKKGDVIATLENSLNIKAKNYLENLCLKIQLSLEEDEVNIEFNDYNITFGSIQAEYSQLKTSILAYQYFQSKNTQQFTINNLKEQIKNHITLRSVTYHQLNTSKRQLERAKNKFESDKRLYDKGVISKIQFYEEENKLIQVENEVSNFKKGSVQNSIAITDLNQQLNQLITEYDEQLNNYRTAIESSLKTIQNSIESWGRNFEISALISGELSYLNNLSEHQFVESGFSLFAIVPYNQKCIGYITVPQQGYGKIKRGQKVRVKLDNYPYQEYGQLKGVVTSISLIPNEKQYKIEFSLSNGLKSSYGRKFEYTPEMSGTAEIITDDLRLIDRIFNKFRKILD